ncbi:MAG: hypothetical protein AAFX76_02585 [Planctomycetota bacterium]
MDVDERGWSTKLTSCVLFGIGTGLLGFGLGMQFGMSRMLQSTAGIQGDNYAALVEALADNAIQAMESAITIRLVSVLSLLLPGFISLWVWLRRRSVD